MNSALIFALSFFVILGYISGSDIYPSIHWFPHNPVFQANGINCGPGSRQLKVQLQAKLIFVCPNSATVLQTRSSAVQETVMFENLWLLENKTAFDECDVLQDLKKRRLLTCDTPSKLTYSSVTFAQHTAEQDGLTFDGGQTYYFVATSDGTQSHINNTRGGRCRDNNMKIEVYVCKRSNETYQDPECKTGVGKLICPSVTSGTSTPSTLTATDSSITTPSTEGVSAARSIHPSSSVKPSESVCVQTVITETVSSKVAESVSCPNVCDTSASSTDLSKMTLSYAITATKTMTTTEITTKTVTSGILATKTMQPLKSLATDATRSTFVSSSLLPVEVTSTSKHTPLKILSSVAVTETKTMTATEITTETVTSGVLATETVQPLNSLATESTNSTLLSSKSLLFAVTSAIKFTDPCEQCFSRSAQSSPTTVDPTKENGSNEPQLAKQKGLAGNQDDCSGKETWQAVAVLFIVLFILLFLVVTIAIVKASKLRKCCYRRSRPRIAPLEEMYGSEEMKPSDKPEAHGFS